MVNYRNLVQIGLNINRLATLIAELTLSPNEGRHEKDQVGIWSWVVVAVGGGLCDAGRSAANLLRPSPAPLGRFDCRPRLLRHANRRTGTDLLDCGPLNAHAAVKGLGLDRAARSVTPVPLPVRDETGAIVALPPV